MKKKLLFLVSKILISIVCILLFLKFVDFDFIKINIKNVPVWFIFMILVVAVVRTWLVGIRWKTLNSDKSNQISKWQYFKCLMISMAFNSVMPGTVGGDFIRSLLIAKKVNVNKMENVLSVFVDRSVGLISVLFLGAIALCFETNLENKFKYFCIIIGILIMCSLIIVTIFFIANIADKFKYNSLFSKIFSYIQIIKNVIDFHLSHKLLFLKALILCIPIHLLTFSLFYAIAYHLNLGISFYGIVSITSIVWVVTAIPISFAGFGVRELSFIYLFSLYGVSCNQATLFSIYVLITTIVSSLLGFIFIFFKE